MNSTDRCDSCGSQAYVRVSKQKKILDFCGHHFTKLENSLDNQGWEINVDTRDLLTNQNEKVTAR